MHNITSLVWIVRARIILVLILFLNRRVMYELVLDFIIILHNALRTRVCIIYIYYYYYERIR